MARDQLGEAIEVLRRCSIDVVAGDLRQWDLKLPGHRIVSRRVHPVQATLTPKLAARMKEGTLHVVDRAAEGLLEGSQLPERDFVVLDPPAAVIEGTLYRPEGEPDVKEQRRGRGRPSKTRWALERALLLAEAPLTQQQAASVAGASQQSVSKTVRALDEWVERMVHGFAAADAPALLADWEEGYPGPDAGITTWWYGLSDPATQARDAAKLAEDLEAEPLVGGDIAADEYAPWRLPDTAKIYVRHLVDFTPIGLSPAEPDDATLQVVVPADQTLWRTAVERAGMRLVDPLIALWDLEHDPGADAAEAAEQLRERILQWKHLSHPAADEVSSD